MTAWHENMKQSIQLELCRESAASTMLQHSGKTQSADCSETVQAFDKGEVESTVLVPCAIRNIVSFLAPLNTETYTDITYWYKYQYLAEKRKWNVLFKKSGGRKVKLEDESASLWFLQHTDRSGLTKDEVSDLQMETKQIWQDLCDTHGHIGVPWRYIPKFFIQAHRNRYLVLMDEERTIPAKRSQIKISRPSRKVKRRIAVTKKAFKQCDVDDDEDFEEDKESLATKGQVVAGCAEAELPAEPMLDNTDEVSPSSKQPVLAGSTEDEPHANAISTENTAEKVYQANVGPITSTMPFEMAPTAEE
ncbi:hypothetical protein EI94DRAFT_1706625 [Lactarius quietus]|nr:hypothetical protein EI94DRAFT_1706625 [Lactarius quietus]